MNELSGRTAVVTGAASGIGRALAERFARAGMNVVLADIDRQRTRDAAESIVASNEADTMALEVDVRDAGAVADAAAAAVGRFGPVHVLCNNAGVGGGGPVAAAALADWERTLGVNVWGVIHGLRSFLPHMLDHGEPGHVVNTASILGVATGPGFGLYAASKFAVMAISETLYHELAGTNVGVSVLCPGLVNTSIFEHAAGETDDRPADRAMLGALLRKVGMDPARVADLVHDAIVERRFYIFPHPELLDGVEARWRAMAQGDAPPEIATALFGAAPDAPRHP